MPHPTPIAATSASPPPRGEGLGVGGRPHQTRRVCFSAPLLIAALTTATQAQIIPTGTPAADILLSQAISEHKVFLTCSALDPLLHAQILTNWQRDVAAAAAILKTNNVPADAITAFTTAADPAALMPTDDTPWAEVKGLCATRPGWMTDYYQFNLVVLELKLPEALQ